MIRVLATCVCLAGCASSLNEAPAPPMPASAKAGQELMDKVPACLEHHAYDQAPATGNIPQLISICAPNFPMVLQRNGYQSACLSDFNVSPDGSPKNIRAVCQTVSDGDSPADEMDIADAMFVRLMERAMSEMEFGAPPDGSEIDGTRRFLQRLKFAFKGEEEHLFYPPESKLEDVE